ncbi:MAG: Riboflavin biosynthesis protein [Verrucomicrobiales bacterium]|nr:Riboflavin biosynthesis protein [Verrucomicrobiales bacterium]
MNLIHHAAELNPGSRKVCVAIGVFDGVHLGHQQVIRQTMADAVQHQALSVVVTFDRHPNAIVAPERVPSLIYPLAKKLSVIESLNVNATYLIEFTKDFSTIAAEQFVRDLTRDFKSIQSICVGSNFTFGHKRGGNVDLLGTLGKELNFQVHGLASVALDGQPVSSTRVREMIRIGNLDLANQMLGRTYALCGPVIKGDGIGRKIGFPTANIDVTGLVLPPTGVYAVRAEISGKVYGAALNIGYRPTLSSPTPKLQVEAHLLDFAADIYGETMELTIVRKLRDEQKFASTAALHDQIAKDIEAARKSF